MLLILLKIPVESLKLAEYTMFAFQTHFLLLECLPFRIRVYKIPQIVHCFRAPSVLCVPATLPFSRP